MQITLNGTKVTLSGSNIGFSQNNLVNQLRISVDTTTAWSYKLDVIYPSGLTNIIDLPRVGNTCTVNLTSTMLAESGKYRCQIRGINGDQVYHTNIFEVFVKNSLNVTAARSPLTDEELQFEKEMIDLNQHPPKPDSNSAYWMLYNVKTKQYEISTIPYIGITEAPNDGKTYGRKNKAWAEVAGSVISVNGKTGEVTLTTNDLTNDSGFITNAVNDLVNYYLKSETYTKTEVNELIATIKQFTYTVVDVLPTASASTMYIIYLVPASSSAEQNVKDEYITIDNGASANPRYTWEKIGSTSIDLSNYYTKTEVDTALGSKVDKASGKGLSTNDYTDADKTKVGNAITEHQSLANYSTTAQMNSAIEGHHDSTKADVTAISDMATKTWVEGKGYLTQHQDISGKENTSNKVTSISSASTDTQYPSAKAVYDELVDKAEVIWRTY